MRAAVSKRESISAFSSRADSQRFRNFALANTKTLAARQLFYPRLEELRGLTPDFRLRKLRCRKACRQNQGAILKTAGGLGDAHVKSMMPFGGT
jgi:hypothetical protein